MTTQITLATEIPPETPQLSKSLSQQELQEHRTQIGIEVQAVVGAGFQPKEDPEARARRLAWWCDELHDWQLEQVVWALRKWNRDNPRVKPTPGDVRNLLIKARGKDFAERMAKAPPPPEPERERVSPERSAEIMAEVMNAAQKMKTEGK